MSIQIIPDKTNACWDGFLNKNMGELERIQLKIGSSYYPCRENVLRFMMNDISNVKCVIMGMEPYCTDYQRNGCVIPEATGRSFEVDSVDDWGIKFRQSSLRNILKAIYYCYYGEILDMDTLREYIQKGLFDIPVPKEWFNNLESQGVLFLNASLTVTPHMVDSHSNYWTSFMNNLIEFIDDKSKPRWLLWGNKAKDRVLPLIDGKNVICSPHPRLFSFVEDCCFKRIPQINWLGMKEDITK